MFKPAKILKNRHFSYDYDIKYVICQKCATSVKPKKGSWFVIFGRSKICYNMFFIVEPPKSPRFDFGGFLVISNFPVARSPLNHRGDGGLKERFFNAMSLLAIRIVPPSSLGSNLVGVGGKAIFATPQIIKVLHQQSSIGFVFCPGSPAYKPLW